MNTSSNIVAIAVALVVALPGSAYAAKKRKASQPPPCISASAVTPAAVYTLKTELMTAALSCGPDARQQYNQFVGLREFELTKYGGQLKNGLGSRTNHFVTEVANKTGGQLDCDEAARHFEQVLSPDMPLLETVVTPEWAQQRHGHQVCPVKAAKKGKKK